jgi:hypothetical protein
MMSANIKKIGMALGVATIGVVGYLSLSGQYVPGGGGGTLTRQDLEARKEYRYREEFELSSTTSAGKFSCAATGTTVASSTAVVGHPFVMTATTSTGATDNMRCTTNSGLTFGDGVAKCVEVLMFINVLGTANVRYVERFGFAEPTGTGDSVDAVEARYQGSGSQDFWEFATRSNSTETNTVTSCAVSAATWYKHKICVNAAGTSATLTINDVLCATHTTNIPTGLTRATGLGIQHQNDTGAAQAAVFTQYDYVELTYPFSPTR